MTTDTRAPIVRFSDADLERIAHEGIFTRRNMARELLARRAQVRRYEEALERIEKEHDGDYTPGHAVRRREIARDALATRTPDAGRAEPQAEAADLPRTDSISAGTTIAKPCPMCSHSHHGRDKCGESMTMGQSAEGVYGGTYIVSCPCEWKHGTSPREPAEPDEAGITDLADKLSDITMHASLSSDPKVWSDGVLAIGNIIRTQCAAAREAGRVEGLEQAIALASEWGSEFIATELRQWLAARRPGGGAK